MPHSIADPLQSIPMSPNLTRSLGRAHEFARTQSHRTLSLEHLLLALTEDLDAAEFLRACNVDVTRLGTDVSGYLGRLPEDMRAASGSDPSPDSELLRVVDAARQAAQSKRRAIDGAIVLAAIVGDAKSPAAGLLKTHGVTFEGAIKTLQKASALNRSKQYTTQAVRQAAERTIANDAEKEPVVVAAPAPVAERPAAPSAADVAAAGQSPDEILAAARARIQQRTGVAKVEAKAAEAAKKAEPEPPALMSLSAFTAARAQAPAAELPQKPDGPAESRQGLEARLEARQGASAPADPATPPPAAPDAAGGPPPPIPPGSGPPPVPSESKPPPPPRGARSREGPPPPPPPPPRRGDRARPEPAERGPPRRPVPNGAMGGPRRPSPEPARAGGRSGQRSTAGPLLEAIPRRMRVGAATSAQVRIGRDQVDRLAHVLMGHRAPEAAVARALSVRLRAPDGGFVIEPVTPETQWIDAASARHDDISWRWTVTPQRRGRRRLQLAVAVRMVGRDGLPSDASSPERTIDVVVRPNRLRRLVRWAIVLTVFGLGGTLGWLGQDKLPEDVVELALSLYRQALDLALGLLKTSGFLGGGR